MYVVNWRIILVNIEDSVAFCADLVANRTTCPETPCAAPRPMPN